MEQWYQKKIHMFCSFVTIDPIAFAEFFERNVFFLLINLPRFNVPDDLSHHGQGTTSLQYIDTRWLFRGWRDHAGHLWMLGSSHGVSHVNPKIPLAVYVYV